MELNLNSSTKNVGLYLSGGVESSLLLYYLAKTNLTIRCYTLIQQNVCMDRIRTIINWVNLKLSNNITFLEEIHDKNPTSDRTFVRWVQLYLRTGEVDEFLIGSNKFMPHLPERQYVIHPKVLIPFKHMYKNEIIELYRKEDICDLLELTHSCYLQKYEHCGTCMNCVERNWSIELVKEGA
jgi:hypothetical protein